MRLANLGYTLGLSAAVAMLFGCGGSQPPAAAPGAMRQTSAIAPRVAQRPSWMKFGSDPASDDSYTFVSQMWQTSVAAYPTNNRENGGPICSAGPVSFPEGIAIDGSGVLYVVASFPGDKSGIATFGPSCGSAGRTFMSPKGAPLDPTVDGTTLYVTDSDRIEVYDTSKKGSSPIRKLSEGSGIGGIGLAVDSHHDLLWSTLAQPWMGGEVVLFANGQMPGKVLPATRIGHDFPGGVVIDRSDNLLLVDQTDSAIYVYAPPYNRPAFFVIPLKGVAVYCALAPRQTRLYCLDYQYGSVDAYTYPGGRYLYSYTTGIKASREPVGIAIQPASLRGAPK